MRTYGMRIKFINNRKTSRELKSKINVDGSLHLCSAVMLGKKDQRKPDMYTTQRAFSVNTTFLKTPIVR